MHTLRKEILTININSENKSERTFIDKHGTETTKDISNIGKGKTKFPTQTDPEIKDKLKDVNQAIGQEQND